MSSPRSEDVAGRTSARPGRTEAPRLSGNQAFQRLLAGSTVQHFLRAPTIQRTVDESRFPADGRVDDVRPGEHLFWNFGIGQHTLKREHQAQIPRIVQEIRAALSQSSDAQVDLEGQASSSGTLAQNEPLARQRAEAVRDALVAAGIDASRIRLTAVASAKALPTVTPENMARSRAVRVILTPRVPFQPAQSGTPAPAQIGNCQVVMGTNLSLTGGPVRLTPGRGGVVLQAGDPPATPGMVVSGAAGITPASCGDLLFVQNVLPYREIVYKDGTRNRFETRDWHLDTSDPYPSQSMGSGSVVAQFANDSPLQGIDSFSEGVVSTVEARDQFRMFFLFQPRNGGARQPLQVGEWTWVGQARTNDPGFFAGSLQLDTGVSRVIPQNGSGTRSTVTPVLSPNVTSLMWQTDTGGDRSPNTFAAIHVTVLNRRRPRAEPGAGTP